MLPQFPGLFVFCLSKIKSLHLLKPFAELTEGHSPHLVFIAVESRGKMSSRQGPRSTTGLSSSSVTERKSRTLSKHQENQLKDIQRPKSYMVRFALNLKFTEGTGSEFTHAHRLPPEESRISDGSLHKEETCGGD